MDGAAGSSDIDAAGWKCDVHFVHIIITCVTSFILPLSADTCTPRHPPNVQPPKKRTGLEMGARRPHHPGGGRRTSPLMGSSVHRATWRPSTTPLLAPPAHPHSASGTCRARREGAALANHSQSSALGKPTARPIMILPQVHLRKPCYDFYFIAKIELERLLGNPPWRSPVPPNPIRRSH